MKVAIADVDKTVGQTAAAELEENHGSGRVLFLECDVASNEMLKGKATAAVSPSVELKCHPWDTESLSKNIDTAQCLHINIL